MVSSSSAEIYIFEVVDGMLRSAVAVEDNLTRAKQLDLGQLRRILEPA